MEKELAEIKKEVIEGRNLVIKTDNLLKTLHAELKMLSRRQDEIARRGWLGSWVAYLGIGVLAVSGSMMAANARVASARDEVIAVTRQLEELKGQVSTLQTESNARKSSAEAASRVYQQIADGSGEARLKGVDALSALDRSKLSALESRALDDRSRLLKVELANTALEEGKNAFRRNEWKNTALQLNRFLTLAPESSETLGARFMVGSALFELKEFTQAIPHLVWYVEKGKGQKNLDYAKFLLGASYETLGDHQKAAEVLKQAAGEHPGSEFIPMIHRVYAQAVRAQAAAEKAAADKGAAPAEKAAKGATP